MTNVNDNRNDTDGGNKNHGGRRNEIIGTPFPDVLFGTPEDDLIRGLAGADRLVPGQGNDEVRGGPGRDIVSYEDAPAGVVVDLGAGTAADDGFRTVDELINVENIRGSGFDDILRGDEQSNDLRGLAGIDLIDGGAGNDTIGGGIGDDQINGGLGNDTLRGGAGNDTIDGGAGEDTVDYSGSPDAVFVDLEFGEADDGFGTIDRLRDVENIIGSELSDDLIGDDSDNVIDGGAGDDIIQGLGGADRIDGGPGFDLIDFEFSPDGVRVNLEEGTADDGFGSRDTVTGIEDIDGSNFDDELTGDATDNFIFGLAGNDRIDGRAGPDLLDGQGGNDVIDGGAGDDEIFGGNGADELRGGPGVDFLFGEQGNDIIDGGGGFDFADYSLSPGGIVADLQTGIVQDGHGTEDSLKNIEGVVGSDFADILRGNDGSNVFEGLAGDDVINGRGGINRVDYEQSPAPVTVDLRDGLALDGFGFQDTLINVQDILGSGFADRLRGDDGANVIEGLGGNDVINGRGGFDTADYFFSPAGVSADLSNGTAADGHGSEDELIDIEGLRGSDFDDILIGDHAVNVLDGLSGNDELRGLQGDDIISGRRGADTVEGNRGRDTLDGGPGADILIGGLGADRLTGGNGPDRFVYAGVDQGGDRITDFAAEDLIDLAAVLTGFDPATSDPSDFVNLVDSGANAILQVDPDGGGDFRDLAILEGAAGTSVADLVANDNLVLSDGATS